ncbi:MEDS: MEthanogen/methylotroph, DcmR Sensory domain [Fictibacillus solisalsi]|uniref:MEDS: MEthanogen/methylotroph, DcmR Sensory domain n=1 Tax=Fictibacillus solisalsi TaxID=459525 RepID=A0A1G9YH72_9BACL|nr:MEDS domain-containing protein [Fictibacillus solisalsi]SDN08549.1 MEDS: MEthanogen/methylotroph, DcmR Sensory domain [Fictibacillus solisalsi]
MGQPIEELRSLKQGHILYKYENEVKYLSNLLSFIMLGLKRQHRVLVVESEKNLPKLKEQLESLIPVDKMSEILLINNFDFYLLNGDFHTHTIVNHFSNQTMVLDQVNKPAWTWAHVEWSSQEANCELVQKFEFKANEVIHKERRLSVCAYPLERLTPKLNSILSNNHDYLLSD